MSGSKLEGYELFIDGDDILMGLESGELKITSAFGDEIEEGDDGYYFTGGKDKYFVPGMIYANRESTSGTRASKKKGGKFDIVYDYRPTLQAEEDARIEREEIKVEKAIKKKEDEDMMDDLMGAFSGFGFGKSSSDDDTEMSGKRKMSKSKLSKSKMSKSKLSKSKSKTKAVTKRRKRCKRGTRRNKKSKRCVKCGGLIAKKNHIC